MLVNVHDTTMCVADDMGICLTDVVSNHTGSLEWSHEAGEYLVVDVTVHWSFRMKNGNTHSSVQQAMYRY